MSSKPIRKKLFRNPLRNRTYLSGSKAPSTHISYYSKSPFKSEPEVLWRELYETLRKFYARLYAQMMQVVGDKFLKEGGYQDIHQGLNNQHLVNMLEKKSVLSATEAKELMYLLERGKELKFSIHNGKIGFTGKSIVSNERTVDGIEGYNESINVGA